MRLLFAALASILVAGTVEAEVDLEWADLVDVSAQAFEDPFKDLSYDQLDDLVMIVRLRQRLENPDLPDEEREKFETRLSVAEERLDQDGIDVSWLLSQRLLVAERREKAAWAGNSELDGKTVTVAGFAIPGPLDDTGTATAYLVPERGMCSHMPPPPPNQMIRVRLSDAWMPSYMHEPVQLTGRLNIEPSERQVMVVDGLMPLRSTFDLEVESVRTLGSEKDRRELEKSDTDRIRAAMNHKTGGAKATE